MWVVPETERISDLSDAPDCIKKIPGMVDQTTPGIFQRKREVRK